MSKNNEDPLMELVMAPFEAIGMLIVVAMFIVVLAIGYGIYDTYYGYKCSKCHTPITMGEYCKNCGTLATDSTTYNKKWK